MKVANFSWKYDGRMKVKVFVSFISDENERHQKRSNGLIIMKVLCSNIGSNYFIFGDKMGIILRPSIISLIY